MNEQQIAEMKRVVEKMPEVFQPEFDSGEHHYQPQEPLEYRTGRHAIPDRFLSPAQHAVWVCECLMGFLEEKGYHFHRYTNGNWSWHKPHDDDDQLVGSLWPCLYAAWQHWEAGQEPKGVMTYDQAYRKARYTAETYSDIPAHWTVRDDDGSVLGCGKTRKEASEVACSQEGQKPEEELCTCTCVECTEWREQQSRFNAARTERIGEQSKEKTLQDQVRKYVDDNLSSGTPANRYFPEDCKKITDDITSIVVQYIEDKRPEVAAIVRKWLWETAQATAMESRIVTDAIMAAFGEKE